MSGARPERPFPPRRRGTADFADPKFGTSDDKPNYERRRVDLIGRSIVSKSFSDPVAVLRNYLREGKTASARSLSLKPVVLIEPKALCGMVIWPESAPRSLSHLRRIGTY